VSAVFFTLLVYAANAGVEAQLRAGNLRGALTQLDAIPPEARDAGWHLQASKAYDGLDEAAKAVAEAQEAIRLSPNAEAAHLQLAQIFLSRNTPQPAYEILSAAETMFPNSALVRLGLGLSLQALQRYDEAIKVLTECLRLNPDVAAAFDALGSAYLESAGYEDLLAAATEYARRKPADFRGHYYGAAARDKLGMELSETESLLRRAIECNSRFAASYALLGKVLVNSGRLQPAAAALEQAIRLRPDYTPAHYYLATVYKRLGRAEEAQRELREVARLNEEAGKPVPKLSYHRGERSGLGANPTSPSNQK
jgi:tetratricopeptide (TPR) repeat protein